MARIYLDENTTVRLIEPLVAAGHDTVSASFLGYKGRVDAEQLLIATGLGRILLTYDREDFLLLHEAWVLWSRAWGTSHSHAGILVIHPAPNLTVEDVARAVDDGLSRETAPIANRLLAWKRHVGWYEIPVRY